MVSKIEERKQEVFPLDNNTVDCKRYIVKLKRGVAWSKRVLEITNEYINYYKPDSTELRFKGLIKDFNLVVSKEDLLILKPKDKKNSLEVKITADDINKLKEIKERFDIFQEKDHWRKSSLDPQSKISIDNIIDNQSQLSIDTCKQEMTIQNRRNTIEPKSKGMIEDKTEEQYILIDDHEDHEFRKSLFNKDERNNKGCIDSSNIQRKASSTSFDIIKEKPELYTNICYTKYSIIDSNSQNTDDIKSLFIFIDDSFIGFTELLKQKTPSFHQDKYNIFTGLHLILLLSFMLILSSFAFFLPTFSLSFFTTFLLVAFVFGYIFFKYFDYIPNESLYKIKDPQFDYNIFNNKKTIIRISSFFKMKLKPLIESLIINNDIMNKSYCYFKEKISNGKLIYQSSLFNSHYDSELDIQQDNNWRENIDNTNEIIINEKVNEKIIKTFLFEEKNIDNNLYSTKVTIYLRLEACFYHGIPITYIKDSINSLDKIHSFLQ